MVDVLGWPVVGRLLKWRHARTAIQLGFLLAAVVLVAQGLFGSQVAPDNLATVVTWVHYRGLLVIALLAAGNLFCTGCPFVLVRDLGRRVHRPTLRWPRWLRTKWIAIVLFAAVLFSYELFDLWALPRGTALLVLAYFGAALSIDLVFSGATFCKYLCPIGQFNFVASTMSPLELRVQQPERCRTCRTFDCIKGNRHTGQRGCELGLFLPSKIGNLDCTFCLDCVQACPHDNVALAARVPGAEVLDLRRRSGIGKLAQRGDIAALAVLFTFGGLLNALAMVAPGLAIERWLARLMGSGSEAPALAGLFVLALGVAPAALMGGAAWASRLLAGGPPVSLAQTAACYAWALVPLGFGVWLAHYGFHFLTGALTIVPVTQSAVAGALGWTALGEPLWQWAGMRPGHVYPIQIGFVVLGALGSLTLTGLVAERDHPDRPVVVAIPWFAVVTALAVAACWILSQPMDMRAIGVSG
jgi:ferredoxin